MKTEKISMNNNPGKPAPHGPQKNRFMTEGHCAKNLTGSLLPQYDEYGCLLLSLRRFNHRISLLPTQLECISSYELGKPENSAGSQITSTKEHD